MRIIRTELYFDEDKVEGYEPYRRRSPREGTGKNPGVSFLWIRRENDDLIDIGSSKAFRPLRGPRSAMPPGDIEADEIRGILDLFIRDADEDGFFRDQGTSAVENRAIVEFVLDQKIVMENSPPFSIAFKALLDKKNSPMWIGTFIGSDIGWDHPILLFLTVPGGIIVVSSALGIGAAMQAGLNQAIKRLFDKGKR